MRKIFGLVLILVFVFVLSEKANANLITNGSFEKENYNISNFKTLYSGSTLIPGWTVIDGEIDWIGGYWSASDGDKSLDMNGCLPGTILSDSFNTNPGKKYHVTFDMAGNPGNSNHTQKTLTLTIGNYTKTFTFDTSGHTKANMGWQQKSYFFIATLATTQLKFSGDSSAGCCGPALDNVVVTEVQNSVPEPATALLLFTGLGLIPLVRRKRK